MEMEGVIEGSISEYDLIKSYAFSLNHECDNETLKDLLPDDSHTILFNHESLKFHDHVGPPIPLEKSGYVDYWNDEFVKMPFSDSNLNDKNQKQWIETTRCLNLLADTLSDDPDSIYIEYAIKRINPKISKNFEALHYIFNHELEGQKGEFLLKDLIPRIVKLALSLPNKITRAIPLLKANRPHSITISQEQCAAILANAFFCTFPERSEYDEIAETMPFINFDGLYSGGDRRRSLGKQEKLKCLLHYFQRVTTEMPIGTLTFTRKCMNVSEVPDFEVSRKKFRKVLLRKEGSIEDCAGTLQMDFANKYLGGGVLNSGCVQEEIRFVICPELLVSMLFTEVLKPNESVVIKGCERFSSYTGYASTFEFAGDFVDEAGRDEYKRLYTHVLALDAIYFARPKSQFDEINVHRELIKCMCGFKQDEKEMKKINPLNSEDESEVRQVAIATGNWGCGAFNGDIELKFLIQMIAAAETGRDLIYFTFYNEVAYGKLEKIVEIVQELNVSQVYELIGEYAGEIGKLRANEIKHFGLGEFMLTKFSK